MSFPSGSDMMSKELQNSDFIYVNQMTDVLKIIVKYRYWEPSLTECELFTSAETKLFTLIEAKFPPGNIWMKHVD